MTKESKYISIKQILINEPYDIPIPGIGIVKVKDPTEEDQLEAEVSASKHPMYDKWDEVDKAVQTKRELAKRMIVKPKMTDEEFNQSNLTKMEMILDTIILHYTTKMSKITAKRSKLIKDFLEVMKVKD